MKGCRSPESVTSDKVVVSPSKLSHVCLCLLMKKQEKLNACTYSSLRKY